MSNDETLGELSRRLDRADSSLDKLRADAVDSQLYAAERAHMLSQLGDLITDVKALESRMTWAWRAAITGIAFPLLVLLVGGILMAVGQP